MWSILHCHETPQSRALGLPWLGLGLSLGLALGLGLGPVPGLGWAIGWEIWQVFELLSDYISSLISFCVHELVNLKTMSMVVILVKYEQGTHTGWKCPLTLVGNAHQLFWRQLLTKILSRVQLIKGDATSTKRYVVVSAPMFSASCLASLNRTYRVVNVCQSLVPH